MTEYKNSIFKIKDIDVDDSIGAMYEAPYYGRVISKSDDSIKVNNTLFLANLKIKPYLTLIRPKHEI